MSEKESDGTNKRERERECVSGQKFRVIFNVQKTTIFFECMYMLCGFFNKLWTVCTVVLLMGMLSALILNYIFCYVLRYTSVGSDGTISVPAVIPNEKFDTRNVHATNFFSFFSCKTRFFLYNMRLLPKNYSQTLLPSIASLKKGKYWSKQKCCVYNRMRIPITRFCSF